VYQPPKVKVKSSATPPPAPVVRVTAQLPGVSAACPAVTTVSAGGVFRLAIPYPRRLHLSEVPLLFNASDGGYAPTRASVLLAAPSLSADPFRFELRRGTCFDRVSGAIQLPDKCAGRCDADGQSYCQCFADSGAAATCSGTEGECLCLEGTEGPCREPATGRCVEEDANGVCPARAERCAGIPCSCDTIGNQGASGSGGSALLPLVYLSTAAPALPAAQQQQQQPRDSEIRGVVVEALTKLPAAGAVIVVAGLADDGSNHTATATASADGTFVVDALPRGAFTVTAAAAGAAPGRGKAAHEGVRSQPVAAGGSSGAMLLALPPAVGADEVAMVLQWGPTPENRSAALDAGSAGGVSRDLDLIAVFDAVKPAACAGCNAGTSGPCRQTNNNNCWPYVAGSAECPHYAKPCVAAAKRANGKPRLPPAPCRIFDRRKKCGGASKGAELKRRDQLASPAPAPGAVASRYGLEVLVLRKLLATTYTVAVRNRDLSYATEASHATVTVYTGSGERAVARLPAACAGAACAHYDAPHAQPSRGLATRKNRKASAVARMICLDNTEATGRPTIRRCQRYMPQRAWRFAQRFQRCPPAVDDECLAADGAAAPGGVGWRCSRNLPGAMLTCPGGLASVVRCPRHVACVQHVDAGGNFPAASMSAKDARLLMCPAVQQTADPTQRRRRRRRRRRRLWFGRRRFLA